MKQHGMVWAYLFLTMIALTLMGMGRANDNLDDTHSSVAVQQAGHSQAGEPLPVTPTPLAVTVTAAMTVTAQATIITTPVLTSTATATFIPTTRPTPELNPFTPTPTNTAMAIFLPSVVREDFRSLRNGDFEAGKTVWKEKFIDYGIIFSIDELGGVLPHSGEWAAWLGGYNDEESALTQTVTVPLDRPFLRYWYKVVALAQDCAPGIATVNINQENIYREFSLCDIGGQDWTADTIDLYSFRGQTVTLQFFVKIEAEGAASSFFVDDIEWIAP